MTSSGLKTSGIWDNHHRGSIGDFLKEKILQGSDLSFVSAYFTIYAYAALKDQLDQIDHLRFLFGEPQFIQSLDPDKTEKKAFRIEDDARVECLTSRFGLNPGDGGNAAVVNINSILT